LRARRRSKVHVAAPQAVEEALATDRDERDRDEHERDRAVQPEDAEHEQHELKHEDAERLADRELLEPRQRPSKHPAQNRVAAGGARDAQHECCDPIRRIPPHQPVLDRVVALDRREQDAGPEEEGCAHAGIRQDASEHAAGGRHRCGEH
jgi:hypothetical protein